MPNPKGQYGRSQRGLYRHPRLKLRPSKKAVPLPAPMVLQHYRPLTRYHVSTLLTIVLTALAPLLIVPNVFTALVRIPLNAEHDSALFCVQKVFWNLPRPVLLLLS